jgi:hypothetical protein
MPSLRDIPIPKPLRPRLDARGFQSAEGPFLVDDESHSQTYLGWDLRVYDELPDMVQWCRDWSMGFATIKAFKTTEDSLTITTDDRTLVFRPPNENETKRLLPG